MQQRFSRKHEQCVRLNRFTASRTSIANWWSASSLFSNMPTCPYTNCAEVPEVKAEVAWHYDALCEWIAEHLRISAVDDYSESRTLSSRLVHPPPQGDSIGSVEISGEPRFRASRGSDDTSAEEGSCCGITTEE